MNRPTIATATLAISRSAPGADLPASHTTEAVAIELHQLAHNALASAAWHVARGEATQALSRIKRAQAHLLYSMETRAV